MGKRAVNQLLDTRGYLERRRELLTDNVCNECISQVDKLLKANITQPWNVTKKVAEQAHCYCEHLVHQKIIEIIGPVEIKDDLDFNT